jgi:hypothetical protein
VPAHDLGRVLARHWLLVALVAAGLALRVRSTEGLGAAPLACLVAAAACYVVCARWGCWRWLAALAALPAAVDSRMLIGQGFRPWCGLVLVSAGLLGFAWTGLRGPVSALGASVGLWAAGLALAAGASATRHDPGVLSLHLSRPVTGVAALVGLAAAFGVGRADPLALRLAAVAAVGAGASSALAEVAWWPAAGAVGLTAVLRGRRGRAAGRAQADEVDEAALADLRARYGTPPLGPVAIVIAAFNEANGIPAVLEALPQDVCGLHADVVVVDDGSSDGTADALAGSRAVVAHCPVNRGQGAALRLGYRIARERGAAYVITTDADGQYDVDDLPRVLQPILDGHADFVSGSRVLGHQETRDRVRRLGVHVFAVLATVLTGRRLTDTSFGLRAMRAEVTASVTLNQSQYQSSELLLGVLSHGCRVQEVPGRMHVRSAGGTKKGTNLVYGRRYAAAMTGTWWREGCPRPVTEIAPALRQTR